MATSARIYTLEQRQAAVKRAMLHQDKYRKEQPTKYLYSLAKRRAKARGIEFNIELNELKYPEFCPLLEIKLDQRHPDLDYHGSLDRIDSTKGYVKGNVMIISHRANRLKNNSTATELALLAKNLTKFEAIS